MQSRYQESVAAQGVMSGATGLRVVEILTSESGTWTIIVTRPDGLSCMVAAGQDWQAVEQETPGDDS